MRMPSRPLPIGTLVLALLSSTSARSAEGPSEDAAAPPAPAERALGLRLTGPDQIGQHERIEFALEVQRVFSNPYDPDEAALNVEVTTPSGQKRRVPAFFQQPCEFRLIERGGRKAEWIYPAGPSGWRARFAPEEVGTHTVTATLEDRGRSAALSFTCVARSGKGYVRVSRSDPRFFEFSDGTSFFPIGQNVAFIGSSQYLDTERAGEVFRKMAGNGANFARVWTCCEDWAMAIEARKSAWGRSWSWNPPFAPIPGGEGYHSDEWCVLLDTATRSNLAVSPSHPVAVRPGTKYQFTGRLRVDAGAGLLLEVNRGSLGDAIRSEKPGQWTTFQRAFTTASNQWWLGDVTLRVSGKGRVWLKQLSLQETDGGPDLLWEADPNRPVRGVYNQPDCFMVDRLVEAAEKHGIYFQLCLFTRDHYRFALADPQSAEYAHAIADAQKLLRYAVARWGWSTHVFAWEYFNENDPGLPTARFHRELGQYLEKVDLYRHLRTTSGWGPAPKHWAHPQLDMADLHWYLRPASKPDWRDEVAAVLDRAALVRSHATNKPAVLGEFGLADDKWGLSPYMKQDKEGVHFHNALWASAFSGLAGTASFWWWETLDPLNAYRHYRPLAEFVRNIPFTTASLKPATLVTEKNSRVLAWLGRDRAWCWIFNPQAAWWNRVVAKQEPGGVEGDSFKLAGMENGAYRVEWWDTRLGKVGREDWATSQDQVLPVALPAYSADIACRISRQVGVR